MLAELGSMIQGMSIEEALANLEAAKAEVARLTAAADSARDTYRHKANELETAEKKKEQAKKKIDSTHMRSRLCMRGQIHAPNSLSPIRLLRSGFEKTKEDNNMSCATTRRGAATRHSLPSASVPRIVASIFSQCNLEGFGSRP